MTTSNDDIKNKGSKKKWNLPSAFLTNGDNLHHLTSEEKKLCDSIEYGSSDRHFEDKDAAPSAQSTQVGKPKV